jgi:hypothetical protein
VSVHTGAPVEVAPLVRALTAVVVDPLVVGQPMRVALGPAGPPGPQGPPGTPVGRRWYGMGTPGTIVGSSPGDEYLDIETGTLFRLT